MTHVVLVMRVVSVIRGSRRLGRTGAFGRRRDRRGGGDAAPGTSVFRGRGGVTFVGRQARFGRRSTAIADTVAATGLTRVMLVRTRSSTPTMVSTVTMRRSRRRDTVVG